MAEKGSDLTHDFSCSRCEDDGKSTDADLYCEQCSKGFCEECVKLHNEFYKTHSTYGREGTKIWPVTKKTLDGLYFCYRHPEQRIELFCEDHSKLCCLLCHLNDHRQCSRMVLIGEKATSKHQPIDWQSLSANIDAEQKKIENVIEITTQSMQELTDSYDKSLEEIKVLRKKIDEMFDKLEAHTIQTLATLYEALKNTLQSDKDKCVQAKDDLKRLKDVINDIKDKTNDLSFVAYTKTLELISQAESMIKDMSTSKKVTIQFQANIEIEHNVSSLVGLGDVMRSEKHRQMEAGPILHGKDKCMHKVGIKSDENTCDIRGICELLGGDILIVDYSNKRVKLLDKQYTVVAHTYLPVSPHDMCSTSPTEVAVTVDGAKTHAVQFLSVNNRQIVKGRTLYFGHRCNGIDHCNGNLYITSVTVLYQYTLDGQLMKKIEENSLGYETVYKCAVSHDGTELYVTNFDNHKLLTLSIDGTLLSALEDPALRGPRGVHVSETGQLLVCGCGSHNVVQVDGEGGVVTLASKDDGLNHPESVYYSARTGRVIVGNRSDAILVINTK